MEKLAGCIDLSRISIPQTSRSAGTSDYNYLAVGKVALLAHFIKDLGC